MFTITEIRIKLVSGNHEKEERHLKAFCSILIDGCFCVQDLKVIDSTKGLFIAMPSRKIQDRCLICQYKNYNRAYWCNNCGNKLKENRAIADESGRLNLFADVVHPIDVKTRKYISDTIIDAYFLELEKSKRSEYHCNNEELPDISLVDTRHE